ncbi:hypothetical protein [Paenibacillus polymyxa]|uniref:Uncharacterized protein n=1 Tax=Paenibacillus polymyxa (strain SC2) TaxID=886882 RepID=E3EJV4_PAEPS|nr:hypothetical protein [Paenibacillus polymyxa]ADO59702.1 hypothetical protein PPSC2_26625 [Paenibacillus polymyxa SC2]WPQ59476.1 hypothetical protein SKN87_27830 [Paenibacillus polymyxa]
MEKRNWNSDMELCCKATGGAWREFKDSEGVSIGTVAVHPQLKSHAPVITMGTSAQGKYIYISQNDIDFIIACREALPYWLEQVQKERERADAAEMDFKNLQNLMVHKIDINGNGLDFKLSGEAGKFFMYSLVQFFEQNGGKNYLTFDVGMGEHDYSITIQNNLGHSITNQLQEKDAEIARLKKIIKDAHNENERMLQGAGMEEYESALSDLLKEGKEL